MKTAEEVLSDYPRWRGNGDYEDCDIISAMEEYASQFKVELPSDEEIRSGLMTPDDHYKNGTFYTGKEFGLKMMRDLIKSKQEGAK